MRTYFLSLLSVLIAFTSQSFALSGQLCQVLNEAKSGQFTPSELCQAHGKSFCSNITMSEAICKVTSGSFCDGVSEAQAICMADGGSFCESVKSIPEAVCQAQGGSFCSSLQPRDKLTYYDIYQSCVKNGS